MFVAEIVKLLEDQQLKKLVIMPGGFHPFHPGHFSLYQSAVKAFPDADIYVVSTDDTSTRPFPFKLKQQLAVIAGVPANRFVQVRSPFKPVEVTSHYDPNTTALIFVRSEKDATEHPKPGGNKKDGTPSYLQPYGNKLLPMKDHGYMAYLPTIEFKAGQTGVTSATQIREMWPKADAGTKLKLVQDLYPRIAGNPSLMNRVVSILDQALALHEGESVRDPEGRMLLKKARTAHPFAKSEEEALALYTYDKEKQDIDREDKKLNTINGFKSELEAKMVDLQTQLDALKNHNLDEDAAGVGVISSKKQANDPRYKTSLTVDVKPDTLRKEMAAYFPTKPPTRKK
jgi:LmbE family N-acetylglucosaminyl deacetylase